MILCQSASWSKATVFNPAVGLISRSSKVGRVSGENIPVTPRELKHFLELIELSNSELCAMIPCKPYELSQTISGYRFNARIRQRLAAITKQPEEVLFGETHA